MKELQFAFRQTIPIFFTYLFIGIAFGILMHDAGGNRDQDLEALPRIIEAWQNAGYRFVTVEELMASDSSIPEECCANYRPMPEDAVWPTEIAS